MADVTMVADEHDHGDFDPFQVSGKRAGYRYRLLNNNERNIAAKLRKGYEIVKDSDPEKLSMTDSTPMKKGADLDTTQRFNDVILARIPEDKYQKLVAKNQRLIQHRTGAALQDFKKSTGGDGFNAREGSGGSTVYSGQYTEAQFLADKGSGKAK